MNKNWIELKNKIPIKLFQNPFSCIDTIESICYKNISKQECLNKMKNSDLSNSGYWVRMSDNNSYCLPLNNNVFPNANPMYQVETNTDPKIESSFFLNTNVYPYPDTRSSIIYSNDILLLKNLKDNSFVSNPSLENDAINLSKNDPPSNLQIFSLSDTQVFHGGNSAVPIFNYSYIVICVSGKVLVMTKLSDSIINNKVFEQQTNEDINSNFLFASMFLKWFPGLMRNIKDYTAIQIICPYKKSEEFIGYNDYFYLKYGGLQYLYNENNLIAYTNNEYVDLNDKKYQFKFIPAFDIFYCDRGNCKSVNFSQAKLTDDNFKSYYKNNIVYRDRKCFQICSNNNDKLMSSKITNTNNNNMLFIIISIIIIITIILILIKYINNKY